ncbi:hypothetical protein M8C21_025440, partial [Ambrosia artemisiifolia]
SPFIASSIKVFQSLFLLLSHSRIRLITYKLSRSHPHQNEDGGGNLMEKKVKVVAPGGSIESIGKQGINIWI